MDLDISVSAVWDQSKLQDVVAQFGREMEQSGRLLDPQCCGCSRRASSSLG